MHIYCNSECNIFLQFGLTHGSYLQWSLHFKTTHSARQYSLKLDVVLKWRDIYIENFRLLSLVNSLKMEGIVK